MDIWVDLFIAIFKDRETKTEELKQREIFNPMIHSPDDHSSQCWTRLEPDASTRSSVWLTGAPHLGHHFVALSTERGRWIRMEQPGPKLVPIWVASTADNGMTYFATMPALYENNFQQQTEV